MGASSINYDHALNTYLRENYKDFNEFFARSLLPSSRPVDSPGVTLWLRGYCICLLSYLFNLRVYVLYVAVVPVDCRLRVFYVYFLWAQVITMLRLSSWIVA